MYFDLSHEQKMLRDSTHRFMSQCCKPEHVSELDREARYPYEIYAGWVELGLLGRGIPAEYGGYGGSIEGLAYQAAGRLSRNLDSLRDVAAAKLFGSEAYATIANMGMQIMGAYGYSMEYEMQRHLRDARSTTIGAGSSQTQRDLIASTMGFKQR